MSAGDATTECVPTALKTARLLDLVATGQGADPRVPLLIRGKRGVGKDTLARLIHAASVRQPYSFVKVNCAARPADRREGDLFGHERGSSPLAIRRRLGSFEFANHGTIYLDEIGTLPRALVPKLLHVPPLRQRREEIPVFASFFLEQFNRRYRRDVQLGPDTLATFITSSWPGNIGELAEAVHRLVVGGAMSSVR